MMEHGTALPLPDGSQNGIVEGPSRLRSKRAVQASNRRAKLKLINPPTYNQTKEQNRNNTLRKYGLSRDAYLAMYDIQGGKCKICGDPPWPGKNLCVDHDHSTGRVRGLLCHKCNCGIGFLRDNTELAIRSALYLGGKL